MRHVDVATLARLLELVTDGARCALAASPGSYPLPLRRCSNPPQLLRCGPTSAPRWQQMVEELLQSCPTAALQRQAQRRIDQRRSRLSLGERGIRLLSTGAEHQMTSVERARCGVCAAPLERSTYGSARGVGREGPIPRGLWASDGPMRAVTPLSLSV